MRCCCCNRNLSDFESTLKSAKTGQYLDMCKKCLQDLNIETQRGNGDPDEEAPSEENYWDMDDVELNEFEVDDDE